MADLQPLLPRKISASMFAPIPPPPAPESTMGGSLPSIAMPDTPPIAGDPRLAANSSDPLFNRKSALEADLYKRSNPIAPTTTLGKIGHVAANVGNVLGDIFAPDVMSLVPGTQLYNERIRQRDQDELARASQEQTAEAGRKQEAATTAYTLKRPDIEQGKIMQKLTSSLAPKGIKVSINPLDGTIDTEDDPNSQAYRNQVALASMHDATAEKDAIMSEIQKNHYVPGTPEYVEAQRKLAQIDTRLQIGLGNLGLRAKDFSLKAYGTVNGEEVPGALHDQFGNPVGTAMQANVRPTTTERDAAGRAEDLTAIQGRIEQALQDPEIRDYLGPIGGRLAEAQGKLGTLPSKVAQFQNDLVSYGAFQAGLHPVRGIGALEYFDRVMGGLHQTPEQLAGKLKSNAATAGTVQQEGTMPTKAGQSRAQTAPHTPGLAPSQQSLPKEIIDAIPEGHVATLSDGSKWKKVGGKVEKVP